MWRSFRGLNKIYLVAHKKNDFLYCTGGSMWGSFRGLNKIYLVAHKRGVVWENCWRESKVCLVGLWL
jgi:hypothetical protein